jgi:hypothetical protein
MADESVVMDLGAAEDVAVTQSAVSATMVRKAFMGPPVKSRFAPFNKRGLN